MKGIPAGVGRISLNLCWVIRTNGWDRFLLMTPLKGVIIVGEVVL